jgi:hypothetical protein
LTSPITSRSFDAPSFSAENSGFGICHDVNRGMAIPVSGILALPSGHSQRWLAGQQHMLDEYGCIPFRVRGNLTFGAVELPLEF